jgi:hypothetical protein
MGKPAGAVHTGSVSVYFKVLDHGGFYLRLEGGSSVIINVDVPFCHKLLPKEAVSKP